MSKSLSILPRAIFPARYTNALQLMHRHTQHSTKTHSTRDVTVVGSVASATHQAGLSGYTYLYDCEQESSPKIASVTVSLQHLLTYKRDNYVQIYKLCRTQFASIKLLVRTCESRFRPLYQHFRILLCFLQESSSSVKQIGSLAQRSPSLSFSKSYHIHPLGI